MPVVITGELTKRDMHAPVRIHARGDGGSCAARAVRVVLVRNAVTQNWIGLVADSPSYEGASVTNAAREFVDAACRLPARPLFPATVTWFQRDSEGNFDRMLCVENDVAFVALRMPDEPARSYAALVSAMRRNGVDPSDSSIREAIQWALAD
jgi:hypothetical protein